MKYKLLLKYVYTFYNCGNIAADGIFDDFVEIITVPIRFKLHDQEDGSFIVSEIREDFVGKYVMITYPNKDVLIVHENESCELIYDEYYSAMGDDNHNVYVGTFSLVKE